jgi:hypothetical protein
VNEGPGYSPYHAELAVTILQLFTSDLMNALTTAPMLQNRSERGNKLRFDFLLISQHTEVQKVYGSEARFGT